MTNHFSFESTESLSQQDAATIQSGLQSFNIEIGKIDDVVPLSIVARDEHNEVAGGLLARTWGSCCEVMILWVREDYRGQGVGRRLMTDVERDALGRGCDLIFLDTMSFQAPDFYQSLGYGIDRVITGFPNNFEKFYMSKRLDE